MGPPRRARAGVGTTRQTRDPEGLDKNTRQPRSAARPTARWRPRTTQSPKFGRAGRRRVRERSQARGCRGKFRPRADSALARRHRARGGAEFGRRSGVFDPAGRTADNARQTDSSAKQTEHRYYVYRDCTGPVESVVPRWCLDPGAVVPGWCLHRFRWCRIVAFGRQTIWQRAQCR